MKVTVPEFDNSYFKKLEEMINADFEPIELSCEIEENAKPLDCFNIVAAKVKTHGGKMILGWQVWQTNVLMEAEAHAVWEDKDGKIHDISPKSQNISFPKIVFIEDSRMKYEGKQIQSVRLNITNNGVVDDLIIASRFFFYLQNKGERANYYNLSEILNQEELREIQTTLDWKTNLQRFAETGNSEKSLCYCGSSKIYKNCHRKQLEVFAKAVIG